MPGEAEDKSEEAEGGREGERGGGERQRETHIWRGGILLQKGRVLPWGVVFTVAVAC